MSKADVRALCCAVRQVVAATPGSTIRRKQVKAARKLDLTLRRLLGFWHGEVRRVDWGEAEKLQARIARFWREQRQDAERERDAVVAEIAGRLADGVDRLVGAGRLGALARAPRRKAARQDA